jgi:hypothetical protein
MTGSVAVPMSAAELQAAVRELRPFDARRLNRVLRIDADRALVEVQAGIAWSALASRTDTAFLADWTGPATVGQGVAQNAPGPDGVPLVRHIEAMTVVMPDGELRRISREARPELFRLCVGGQGILGAAYSITLRLPSLRLALQNASSALALPASDGALGNCGASGDLALDLLLPPARLEPFLAQARACCSGWHMEIRGVTVRQTSAENETFLRWADRDYALASLSLGEGRSLGNAVRSTQLRRALIDLALAHDGSFPIAATPEATRTHVEACYPMLKAFMAEKRRLDPAGRLSTPWFRHHQSLLSRGSCEVRWAA